MWRSDRMETEIKVFGTYSDGTFIANITYGDKSFWAYHPGHVDNCLILHETPDYVTRFVVFYENDESMHDACKVVLLRNDLEIDDKSGKGLDRIFAEAMRNLHKSAGITGGRK